MSVVRRQLVVGMLKVVHLHTVEPFLGHVQAVVRLCTWDWMVMVTSGAHPWTMVVDRWTIFYLQYALAPFFIISQSSWFTRICLHWECFWWTTERSDFRGYFIVCVVLATSHEICCPWLLQLEAIQRWSGDMSTTLDATVQPLGRHVAKKHS